MAFQNKSFVLGKESFPEWFKEETERGRARVMYDEDGELDHVIIYSIGREIKARVGDTIVLTRSGVSSIAAKDAKKYGVQQKVPKEEE